MKVLLLTSATKHIYVMHNNTCRNVFKYAAQLTGGFAGISAATFATVKYMHKDKHSRTEVWFDDFFPKAYCDDGSWRNSFSRNFVADAVERVLPAVVNVSVPITAYMMHAAAAGSGFIISKDGFIVTNAHVVEHAREKTVTITLSDGEKRQAVIHSMDKQSDIALLKMQTSPYSKEELPTVTFGSSSKLKPGEFVVAIGSPLNLDNSVTFGIVSNTARPGSELAKMKPQGKRDRMEYIQTDAAINQGNSGGPLINLDAEVVGICASKVQGADGISFAIPMDTAVQIIRQLKERGRVVRPYVGLRMAAYEYRTSEGMKRCVRVEGVVQGSPAMRADLRSGDVIQAINDKPVQEVKDVLNAIGAETGRTIKFTIQRNQQGGKKSWFGDKDGDFLQISLMPEAEGS